MHELNPGRKKLIINLVRAQHLPKSIEWDFVTETISNSSFWKYNDIEPTKATRDADEAARKAGSRTTSHQEPRDIETRHSAFLSKFSSSLKDLNKPAIIFTRRRIPGAWFSISNHRDLAVVSLWGWDDIAPPPIEVFIVREIVCHSLLFSRKTDKPYQYHDDPTGCLFDANYARRCVRASLWGGMCGKCSLKLASWGVPKNMQRDALDLQRISTSIHALKKMKTPTPPRIFISYAREDSTVAEKIRKALDDVNFDVWFDQISLRVGDNWKHRIEDALDECDFVIMILSSTSINKKGYFSNEVRLALLRQMEAPISNYAAFVLPVIIDHCQIPRGIKEINCLDISESLEKGIDRLISDILSHLKERA